MSFAKQPLQVFCLGAIIISSILCLFVGGIIYFLDIPIIPGNRYPDPYKNPTTDQSVQAMEKILGISFPTNTTVIFANINTRSGREWSVFSMTPIHLPFEDSLDSFFNVTEFTKEESETEAEANKFLSKYIQSCSKRMKQSITEPLDTLVIYRLNWVNKGMMFQGDLIRTQKGDYFYALGTQFTEKDLEKIRHGKILDEKKE